MKFIYIFRACRLMKSIYILSNYAFQLVFFFKLCKGKMCFVWFDIKTEHFFSIKIIEILSVTHKESMA